MSAHASTRSLSATPADKERGHRLRLGAAWVLACVFVAAVAVYGFGYYTLSAEARPFSPKHEFLRPGGPIGIKLGMLGVGMFLIIYLYYFRKRFGWLKNLGTTRHWLDFHIMLGLTAPVIIAFHASFKFRGIAGMAFWIMVAVALSGVVGRYLYAQIPRRLDAAECTWLELQEDQSALLNQMTAQKLFDAGDLVAAFHVPDMGMVRHKGAVGALLWMFALDLARPLRVAALRRRVLGFGGSVLSLGGFLRSKNIELERVMQIARRQASLSKRMIFLSRTRSVFQLWHVVHRPFSYAFVVLAALHIATAMLLGYM